MRVPRVQSRAWTDFHRSSTLLNTHGGTASQNNTLSGGLPQDRLFQCQPPFRCWQLILSWFWRYQPLARRGRCSREVTCDIAFRPIPPPTRASPRSCTHVYACLTTLSFFYCINSHSAIYIHDVHACLTTLSFFYWHQLSCGDIYI